MPGHDLFRAPNRRHVEPRTQSEASGIVEIAIAAERSPSMFSGVERDDRGRDRQIQAAGHARHRDSEARVGAHARGLAESRVLVADDDRRRAREIEIVQ